MSGLFFGRAKKKPADPAGDALAAALRQVIATQSCPEYLRIAAAAWLAARPT